MNPLIFLPGLASDTRMWQDQLDAMPSAWTTCVSDVHFRHASIADMAKALLAEHPGDKLVLCGASMGGMVAMEAARQCPERIRGLALLGTSARPETPDIQALREAAMVLFEQGRALEVLQANVPLAFHADAQANAELVNRYLNFVMDAGAEQLVRQNRAVIGRPDARLHLPQLRCPMLVMYGDSDQLTPPECSREIHALAPGSELVVLERCGHMLSMERPQAVNAQLQRWLATL